MYKFIGLIPRRSDVTREFFASYYESNHAPLALRYFRGFAKYLRNHIVEELSGAAAPFDVLSEFWYESVEELAKTGVFLESDLAPIIRQDENQFMNQSALVTLTVDEQLIVGPPRCLEPETEKLVLCLKRSQDLDVNEFSDKLLATARSHSPQWAAYRVCCSVVQHGEQESPWDAVVFVWPSDDAERSESAENAELAELIPVTFKQLASQHLLLRTRSVETDLRSVYNAVSAEPGATCDLSI